MITNDLNQKLPDMFSFIYFPPPVNERTLVDDIIIRLFNSVDGYMVSYYAYCKYCGVINLTKYQPLFEQTHKVQFVLEHISFFECSYCGFVVEKEGEN